MSSNFSQIFEYAYAHLGLVGYTGIAIFVWKTRGLFSEFVQGVRKTVDQIDEMATNHFPHMQESLKTQDGLLHSMDTSLKIIAERTPEQARAVKVSGRRKSR